ncbi:MAG: hypothetical protein ACRYFZ_00675 [Janthinobacterium lividum]
MLPIRQTINALSCLNRTDKAVLIEVCQLAERGEQGWCTAKNDYLIEALASSLRTITRRLALLEERGLLLSQGEGKARKLSPSAGLRACYAGADETARQQAISNLANLATEPSQPSHFEPANLAKKSPEPSQSGEVGAIEPSHNASSNLATLGAEHSHFGSRVYGDQFNQVITSSPPTPSEWVEAQKKIADLEAENLQLKADLLKLVPPVAATPQKSAFETQGPRYSEAALALATTMAALWNISRMPRHGGLWGQLCRYAHEMEQQGKLVEATKQFEGYRLHRQKRNLGPHNLQDFLGSEADGFAGLWCQFDWPAKAQQARVDGENLAIATTAARVVAGNKFKND